VTLRRALEIMASYALVFRGGLELALPVTALYWNGRRWLVFHKEGDRETYTELAVVREFRPR